MVKDMVVTQSNRQDVAAQVLPKEEWDKYVNKSSDFAGFVQLMYHGGCAAVAAYVVHLGLQAQSAPILMAGEVMLGFVSSFYFMGFHEFIHNTAFATKCINKMLATVTGFFIFRGANWFWCFHWLHHRYTQDPERDPELSGGSSDLMDPAKSVYMYMRFLTGWPFGFERSFKMVKMAMGLHIDSWVEEADLVTTVRIESALYVLGYVAFAVGAVMNANIQAFVIWYWLVPHMLGAGHLRFYQFAEHRACETGDFTDLDAWGSGRTTATWFFYRRLAWNMPFHIEHHAWPAASFDQLPAVHERIKGQQPESRCIIKGDGGYLAIHREFLRRVIRGESLTKHIESSGKAEASDDAPAINFLDDASRVAALPRFTMDDVSKHNTQKDCWVIVHGIVIDVTSFLKDHPGGIDVLAKKAGMDASKMFKMIHPARTLQMKLPEECIVGVLKDADTGALQESLLGKANP